jgi:hypothetical protein
LIGIILPQDQPVAISSHCRLVSLHAWLTLQLRFIVFGGPATHASAQTCCTPPCAASPFIPYLRNQQALFNFLFAYGTND